jgi:hypothetical protein
MFDMHITVFATKGLTECSRLWFRYNQNQSSDVVHISTDSPKSSHPTETTAVFNGGRAASYCWTPQQTSVPFCGVRIIPSRCLIFFEFLLKRCVQSQNEEISAK